MTESHRIVTTHGDLHPRNRWRGIQTNRESGFRQSSTGKPQAVILQVRYLEIMAHVQHEEMGNCHIIHPKTEHHFTAVMLHGRGSSGEEFANDFLDSYQEAGHNLQETMPGWRWVFPSSRELWSTAFQELIPAWFEAHSLTDISARQDLQLDGIRTSVCSIRNIIDSEIETVDGDSTRVFLGGISQGAAVGLWTLLCRDDSKPLGGFVGANTWLPFAPNIERVFGSETEEASKGDHAPEITEFDDFVASMVPRPPNRGWPRGSCGPVFLGHGVDDAYVDVELGRQAAGTLERLGMKVEWNEYSGAEEEGHWFKVPEEMDDIHKFLNVTSTAVRTPGGGEVR